MDGVRTTATATNPGGSPNYAYLGTYSPNAQLFSGGLDEVRVYNTALTAAQIAQLYAGRYAGTGGFATYTVGANTTVNGQLFVDDGIGRHHPDDERRVRDIRGAGQHRDVPGRHQHPDLRRRPDDQRRRRAHARFVDKRGRIAAGRR